jgi:thiamine kinase-like enzyme
VVIDFEYAGYNTRGFDIGNHFCEWTADYHSKRPSIIHHDKYPTKAEQLNFLEAYMEAEIAICGYHLTAINLAQYTKRRRRSVTQAIVHGLSNVALSAIHAKESLTRRSSVDLRKEGDVSAAANPKEQQVDTDNPKEPAPPNTPLTPTSTSSSKMSDVKGKGNSAIENEIVNPIKKGQTGNGIGGVSKAEILDSMYKEVNKFALTSHIMWGLWGLIQASQSEIEFDYFEYSMQRLCEFRRRRDEFMSL